MTRQLWYLAAVALSACGATDAPTAADAVDPVAAGPMQHAHHGPAAIVKGPLPLGELARARAATARYHRVEQALADGYVDLGVVLPNMGRHFMNPGLVDATFEADRPELLVYSADERGTVNLVAVEYAIPRALSADAPEGFEGKADSWFDDTRFGLWTLHAWVWRNNPDGIFNPTNRRVP